MKTEKNKTGPVQATGSQTSSVRTAPPVVFFIKFYNPLFQVRIKKIKQIFASTQVSPAIHSFIIMNV